jgi:hypothetical protein
VGSGRGKGRGTEAELNCGCGWGMVVSQEAAAAVGAAAAAAAAAARSKSGAWQFNLAVCHALPRHLPSSHRGHICPLFAHLAICPHLPPICLSICHLLPRLHMPSDLTFLALLARGRLQAGEARRKKVEKSLHTRGKESWQPCSRPLLLPNYRAASAKSVPHQARILPSWD